jgi:hypothetical protein
MRIAVAARAALAISMYDPLSSRKPVPVFQYGLMGPVDIAHFAARCVSLLYDRGRVGPVRQTRRVGPVS